MFTPWKLYCFGQLSAVNSNNSIVAVIMIVVAVTLAPTVVPSLAFCLCLFRSFVWNFTVLVWSLFFLFWLYAVAVRSHCCCCFFLHSVYYVTITSPCRAWRDWSLTIFTIRLGILLCFCFVFDSIPILCDILFSHRRCYQRWVMFDRLRDTEIDLFLFSSLLFSISDKRQSENAFYKTALKYTTAHAPAFARSHTLAYTNNKKKKNNKDVNEMEMRFKTDINSVSVGI